MSLGAPSVSDAMFSRSESETSEDEEDYEFSRREMYMKAEVDEDAYEYDEECFDMIFDRSCGQKSYQKMKHESSSNSDSEEEMEMKCSVKEPGLNELIDLQLANGTFKMGKSIETLLDIKEEDIKKKCPQGVEMDVWITALCIVLIETKFKKSNLWELVISKARKSIGHTTENMD